MATKYYFAGRDLKTEVDVTEYEGEINPDPEELQEVKWFDIDNLPEDIFYPDIEPLKALAKYMKENN